MQHFVTDFVADNKEYTQKTFIPTQDEISGTKGPWNFVQVGL